MHKIGVVYIAIGDDIAVEGAFLSAGSIKQLSPELHVTLFTDQRSNALCESGCFDVVEDVSEIEPLSSDRGSRCAEFLARTPYERTLYLDNDTRVLTRALPDLFAHLDEADIGKVNTLAESNQNSGRQPLRDSVLLFRQVNKSVLMNVLRNDAIAADLRLKTLASSWCYTGNKPDAKTNIIRSDAFKMSTKSDILSVARGWATAGRDDDAARLYDYVGTFAPVRQMRAYWPLAVTRGSIGKIGEEWASAPLKRADLHINYRQFQWAADILGRVSGEEFKPYVLTGRARLALARGAVADAVAFADQAVALAPDSSYAAIIQGAAFVAAGRCQDAINPLTRAAKAGRGGALFLLGVAWLKLEDYDRAAETNRKAMSFDDEDLAPVNNLFLALLSANKYRETAEHADGVLERRIGHTPSLAFKSIALSELDEQENLKGLLRQDQFVSIETLAVPTGFQDLKTFNAALAREIAADPTLAYERNTTRFGHQTGDTSQTTTPAVRALNAQAMAVAGRRARAEKNLTDHPFHQSAPENFTIFSWGVIIGAKGHQAPHYHAHGWLSGVYYIEVPEDITEADPDRCGWLEFGHGDERWHSKEAAMPTRQIRPQEGLLVTFPSFYWHQTRPLRSDKRRISFAFDIIPI